VHCHSSIHNCERLFLCSVRVLLSSKHRHSAAETRYSQSVPLVSPSDSHTYTHSICTHSLTHSLHPVQPPAASLSAHPRQTRDNNVCAAKAPPPSPPPPPPPLLHHPCPLTIVSFCEIFQDLFYGCLPNLFVQVERHPLRRPRPALRLHVRQHLRLVDVRHLWLSPLPSTASGHSHTVQHCLSCNGHFSGHKKKWYQKYGACVSHEHLEVTSWYC
jgi:hypothetical protein